jgi:hypothetical protein
MEVPAGYLFGDSTPSPLKIDFIAFLRDAFDFAVEVLLCDGRLTDAIDRGAALSDKAEREIARAESFVTEMSRALDRVAVGDPDSLAARCAARIRQGAKELVRSEADGARAAVATEQMRAAQSAANERGTCAKAFEALLLRHVLPEAATATQLRLEGATHYEAQVRGFTPYGIDWVVALEIAPSHPLAHILRIDRVVERLEVGAPEEAGWIRKETKVRPHRFDRFHLAELSVDSASTTIKLRAAPDGSGGGFDLSFWQDTPRVQLVRIVEGDAAPGDPFDAVGDDIAKLQLLRDGLVAMTDQLAEHKKALVRASLDDQPLTQLEAPRVLVERLIANIAPMVQQIARRSLAPGELVLKRLLGESHREELFVSKAELLHKLEALPVALRRAFDPLELWEAEGSKDAAGETASPKVVATEKRAVADESAAAPLPKVVLDPAVVVAPAAPPPPARPASEAPPTPAPSPAAHSQPSRTQTWPPPKRSSGPPPRP